METPGPRGRGSIQMGGTHVGVNSGVESFGVQQCQCPTAPAPQARLGVHLPPPPHLSTLPWSCRGWKVLIKDLLHEWTQLFTAATTHPDSLGQLQFLLVLASRSVALDFTASVSRSGIKLHGRCRYSVILGRVQVSHTC